VKPRWNHSINYYPQILREVPTPCAVALDVGCGDGSFARRLAERSGRVDAVDRSEAMIRLAREENVGTANLRFLHSDFLDLVLPEGSYDFVASLSTIHHMEFRAAIERMRTLLRPGGVLAILGVARDRSPRDVATSVIAVAANRALRLVRGWYEPGFPISPPTMSYREVRADARALLPAVTVRRLLLFRYLLLWRNAD